ncbi:acyltransferase domain-containing protein [Nocardiopsis sp. NPDC050513]|uniref:acyltransferase domain-containing protein n=1 Tax=Nocardiopsis sp. NPDC050513 TaxID=3364338 RepID=UPI0037B1ACEA
MTRPIALMFPGQGAQQVRMAAGLYGPNAAFTATMDEAFALFGPEGAAIRADWLGEGGPGGDAARERFDDVTRAQPLLYSVGYALGRAVLDLGLEPAALVGHSVGELVAATLAGVLDFEAGVALIRDRIDVLADSAPGAMLAVAASAADLTPYLRGDVVVGAVNAPWQTLLAGPAEEVHSVRADLRADGFTCRLARSRQAFHSPALDGAVEGTVRAWSRVDLRAPRLPVYSAGLGGRLTADRARDPEFWARQLSGPVLFWPALDQLLHDHDVLLLEAGAGQGLSALARRHPAVADGRSAVVPLLPARPRDVADDLAVFDEAVDRLGAEGHAPRVRAAAGGHGPRAGDVAVDGGVQLPAHPH